MMDIDVAYSEYFDVFSCGQKPMLEADEFEKFIKSAKLFLKSVISEKSDAANTDEVKCCLCALAEGIYLEQRKGGIKTENIDGYSVTYSNQSPALQRLLEIALMYLGNSGLLYAGVE